jgi:hypothetical protein
VGQAEEEENGRVESYEEALVRLNEEHESWLLHPAVVDLGIKPAIMIQCICGKIIETVDCATSEDWIYDRWGKHVEQEIDKLADDYPDEDEVDDIIFVDIDDEELETEI